LAGALPPGGAPPLKLRGGGGGGGAADRCGCCNAFVSSGEASVRAGLSVRQGS
jgi:hypothetical protein